MSRTTGGVWACAMFLALGAMLLAVRLWLPDLGASLDTAQLSPRTVEAIVQTGLPSIELHERTALGYGYHYKILLGGTRLGVVGTADSALEVYWQAASLTLEQVERTLRA